MITDSPVGLIQNEWLIFRNFSKMQYSDTPQCSNLVMLGATHQSGCKDSVHVNLKLIGAVTLTMVNAISHGKLSHGASHLSFSIPR